MKGAALVVAIALLAPSALAADSRIQSSATRVDLGPLAPGDVREGNLTLSNPDNALAEVRLATGEGAWTSVPAALTLAPGGAQNVSYVYRVPANATPGDHGETVLLRSGDVPEGSATFAPATAIVFTSRTRALGVAAIEAPALALPGEPIDGALELVNTWTRAVNATAELAWHDAAGNESGRVLVGPVLVAADGGARVDFRLPAANATPGAQTLSARIVRVDAEGAPLAGNATQPFALGRREATYVVHAVQDMGDGNATVRIGLENTGDVPVTLQPRVIVRGADGVERVVALDPITLLPGERREALGVLALPPGSFRVAVGVEGAQMGVSTLATAPDAPIELHMSAPRDPMRVVKLALAAVGAAALGFVGAYAWRRRAALRSALARLRPAPLPADPFDDLFAKLEEPSAATPPVPAPRSVHGRPAALLLDLDGFGSDPIEVARLTLFTRGRDVRAAYAYARATTHEAAHALQHELAAAGYTPRIVLPHVDVRVLVTIDAMREAHAGRDVLIATHDAAYGPLARAIQEDGGRVEALPVSRRVPVQGGEERLKPHQRERSA